MHIFEQASILKLRFNTGKGVISTEELWDLPLQSKTGQLNLDDLARIISKTLRDDNVESFVAPATTTAARRLDTLRLDILKHIINAKQAENASKLDAAAKKAERERLTALLAKRQEAALEGLSEEELKRRIDALS